LEQAVARATRGLNYLFKAVSRPAAPAETPPLPQGQYRAILADPPWRFETWSSAGLDRAPDNHYPTMSGHDIASKVPVWDIAAADCCLFLWTYTPMLRHALFLIESWEFSYKSVAFVWAKAE